MLRTVWRRHHCSRSGLPQLVTECRRRGWEVIAHGVGQRRAITGEMPDADERAYIRAFRDRVFSLSTNHLPRHVRAKLSESDIYRYQLRLTRGQKAPFRWRVSDGGR